MDRDGVTNGRTKFISVLTEVTKMEPTIALQCVTKSFESLTYNRTSRAASSQLKIHKIIKSPLKSKSLSVKGRLQKKCDKCHIG